MGNSLGAKDYRRPNPRLACPDGGSPWAELNNALLAGRTTNGLWRAAWNLSIPREDACLRCCDLGRVSELGRWPEVLQRGVPYQGSRIHAEVRRHQVEPAIDNPGVDMRVTTGHVTGHRGWLWVGTKDRVVIRRTGKRH